MKNKLIVLLSFLFFINSEFFSQGFGINIDPPTSMFHVLTTSTTGTGINLDANTITTGTGQILTINGLTSGTGFTLSSTAALTGILANYVADAATTGTIMNLSANGLTSGSGFLMSSTSTSFTGDFYHLNFTGNNASNTGTVFKVTNGGGNNNSTTAMISNSGDGLSFRVNDDGSDADATPFVIDETGNAGIGTSSPGHPLHVVNTTGNQGVMRIDHTSSAGFSGIYFYEGATVRGWLGHVNSTSGFGGPNVMQFGSETGDLALCVGGSYQPIIYLDDATENVSIGTWTAGDYRLDVYGNDNSYLAHFQNDGNNTTRRGIAVQAGTDGGVGIDYYFDVYDGDQDYLGGILADNGVLEFYVHSDRRLKKEIKTSANSALDIITKLNIVNYKWKKNDATVNFGFIAQEVETIFPDMVVHTSGKGEKSNQGFIGITPMSLIPVNVKAIQEQQEMIETLIKQNKELNDRLNKLAKKIEGI